MAVLAMTPETLPDQIIGIFSQDDGHVCHYFESDNGEWSYIDLNWMRRHEDHYVEQQIDDLGVFRRIKGVSPFAHLDFKVEALPLDVDQNMVVGKMELYYPPYHSRQYVVSNVPGIHTWLDHYGEPENTPKGCFCPETVLSQVDYFFQYKLHRPEKREIVEMAYKKAQAHVLSCIKDTAE